MGRPPALVQINLSVYIAVGKVEYLNFRVWGIVFGCGKYILLNPLVTYLLKVFCAAK